MIMAISDEITRLQQAKADLKTAIEGKGVTVPSNATIDDYADLVDSIEAGGGGSSSIEDLVSKENLTKIETNISGSTPIILNQSNNFNITGVDILGAISFVDCELSFNGFSIIWHSGGNSFYFYNSKKSFLTLGNLDFSVENVSTYSNGWKHIYFYINDEVVGTVAYDD